MLQGGLCDNAHIANVHIVTKGGMAYEKPAGILIFTVMLMVLFTACGKKHLWQFHQANIGKKRFFCFHQAKTGKNHLVQFYQSNTGSPRTTKRPPTLPNRQPGAVFQCQTKRILLNPHDILYIHAIYTILPLHVKTVSATLLACSN